MEKCCYDKKSLSKIEDLAKVLNKISEKNRLKILCLLKDGPKCVCDIWQCLKHSQNLVSHHLAVLKELNLVSSKKKGRKIFYQLNEKVAKKYTKALNQILT